MKKSKTISAFLIAQCICTYAALGQTVYSGNLPANNTAPLAGAGGSNLNTSVGHAAGNFGMTGLGDTYVGRGAGNSTTSGGANTFVGQGSGGSTTTGNNNTAIGKFSLRSNTVGDNNSAFGFEALFSNTTTAGGGPTENTAMGFQCLRSNTFGLQNTGFGSQAGFLNTTSSFNSYFGFQAGQNSLGTMNCFIGHTTGRNSLSYSRNSAIGGMAGVDIHGDDNTFVGFAAGNAGMGKQNVALGSLSFPSGNFGSDDDVIIGFRAASATPNAPTMNKSVVIGSYANFWNMSGTTNAAVGYQTIYNLQTGFDNSALGSNSGFNLLGGNGNMFLGANADALTLNSTLNNASAIGSNAKVLSNNTMILGDNAVSVGIGLSGITPPPGNKLEINFSVPNNFTAPNTGGGSGFSGLRFRDLTSGSTPYTTNPGNGVLALDANGDVIYVPAPTGSGGCCIGNPCTGPVNPLLVTWEVPLFNGSNYMFNEQIPGGGSEVGIGHGIGTCNNISGKFEVISNSIHRFAGAFINTANLAGIPTVGAGGQGTSTTFDAVGVRGDCRGAAANGFSIGTGVYGQSLVNSGCSFNTGVFGSGANGSALSIGGDFKVTGSNSPQNYGVQTIVTGGTNPGSVNFGINDDVNSNASANIGESIHVVNGTNQNDGADISVTGTSTSNNYGINMTVQGNSAGSFNFGVNSLVTDATGNAFDNIGVFGQATTISGASTNNNIGVVGIGVYPGLPTPPPPGVYNIGVYGEGATAGYFAGPFFSAGAISFSDEKIKTNVNNIESGLSILKKLRPVTYDMKVDEYPELNLSKGTQYGFIAQEVEKVLPEIVKQANKPEFKDKNGKVISKGDELKGVNYTEIIPLLTKGIQEQQQMIEDQQKQIDQLKALVAAQSGMNNATGSNSLSTTLSDKDVVVLDQNIPNPFAEQTIINFSLPENTQRAQMLFYNIEGKLINSVELTEKGKGQLTVFANDLSSGIYTYTLVVDGKVFDTKRMEKQK